MKRYEGLFILNTAGREEGLTEMIDRLSKAITDLGGKIETTQKMDKRPFARVADKKAKEGFYVNFIFDAEPEVAVKLTNHFELDEDVFRLTIYNQPKVKAAAA